MASSSRGSRTPDGSGAAARRGAAAPLATAALALAALLLALGAAELVLRARPQLLSQELLLEFGDRALRRRIAAELDLPVKQSRRCLAPAERFDHGPELCLIEPHHVYRLAADPVDRALGAVERLPHDARGFCNPPGHDARARVRVASLGDSFTWCTLVSPDATFSARLEQALGVSVYDLGVPGVGPYEYLEVLRRHGLALAPEVVLFNVYGGNDLRDAGRWVEARARWDADVDRARRVAAGDAAPVSTRPGDGAPPAPAPARFSSYALAAFAAGVRVLGNRLHGPPWDFGYTVETGAGPVVMNTAGADLDEVRTAFQLAAGELSLAWWQPALADLAALARAHGFEAIVSYLPSAHAAYGEGVVFRDPAVGAAVGRLDRRQREALAALAAREGLRFVDCTPALRRRSREPALLYFPANLHLTAPGHEAVAACLEDAVAEALGAGRPAAAAEARP